MARAFTIMPEQRMLADERRRPARPSLAQGACDKCPMLLETVHVLLDRKFFARRKRFRGAGTLACRVETRLDAWGVSAPRFCCGALPRGGGPRPAAASQAASQRTMRGQDPRGPRTRATCLPRRVFQPSPTTALAREVYALRVVSGDRDRRLFPKRRIPWISRGF